MAPSTPPNLLRARRLLAPHVRPAFAMLSRLLAVLLFAACASGLKMMPPAPRPAAMCSRRAVPLVAAGVAFARRAPAGADDKSKTDKKFISCVSECVYNEQKIAKGIGQVEYVTQKEAYAKCEQHAQKSALGLGRGLGSGIGPSRSQARVETTCRPPVLLVPGTRAGHPPTVRISGPGRLARGASP